MLIKSIFLMLMIAAMVGGNLIVFRSMKRRGIPYSSAFVPTPSGIKAVFGLNGAEWAAMLLVVYPSFLIGAHGLANAS